MRINRGKCSLNGINCDVEKHRRWSDMVRCELEDLPSFYLGLPLGSNHKLIALWDLVVDKVRRRLAPWKKGLFGEVDT